MNSHLQHLDSVLPPTGLADDCGVTVNHMSYIMDISHTKFLVLCCFVTFPRGAEPENQT